MIVRQWKDREETELESCLQATTTVVRNRLMKYLAKIKKHPAIPRYLSGK